VAPRLMDLHAIFSSRSPSSRPCSCSSR
jgi:hypothetical protein